MNGLPSCSGRFVTPAHNTWPHTTLLLQRVCTGFRASDSVVFNLLQVLWLSSNFNSLSLFPYLQAPSIARQCMCVQTSSLIIYFSVVQQLSFGCSFGRILGGLLWLKEADLVFFRPFSGGCLCLLEEGGWLRDACEGGGECRYLLEYVDWLDKWSEGIE